MLVRAYPTSMNGDERLITAIDNRQEMAKALPLTDIPVNPDWTPYFASG